MEIQCRTPLTGGSVVGFLMSVKPDSPAGWILPACSNIRFHTWSVIGNPDLFIQNRTSSDPFSSGWSLPVGELFNGVFVFLTIIMCQNHIWNNCLLALRGTRVLHFTHLIPQKYCIGDQAVLNNQIQRGKAGRCVGSSNHAGSVYLQRNQKQSIDEMFTFSAMIGNDELPIRFVYWRNFIDEILVIWVISIFKRQDNSFLNANWEPLLSIEER